MAAADGMAFFIDNRHPGDVEVGLRPPPPSTLT